MSYTCATKAQLGVVVQQIFCSSLGAYVTGCPVYSQCVNTTPDKLRNLLLPLSSHIGRSYRKSWSMVLMGQTLKLGWISIGLSKSILFYLELQLILANIP